METKDQGSILRIDRRFESSGINALGVRSTAEVIIRSYSFCYRLLGRGIFIFFVEIPPSSWSFTHSGDLR